MRALIRSAALALAMVGPAHAGDCEKAAAMLEHNTAINLKLEMDVRPLIAQARGTEMESEARAMGVDYLTNLAKTEGELRAPLSQMSCAVADPAAHRRITESLRLRAQSAARMRRALAGVK